MRTERALETVYKSILGENSLIIKLRNRQGLDDEQFFRNGPGLYEEINSQGERAYYIFVGHDVSLVIKTSKDYSSLHIKKFSETK